MNPSECCDKIIQKIKISNLHYMIIENPFSVKITIRKKYIEERNQLNFKNDCDTVEVGALKEKLEMKNQECQRIEKDKMNLTSELKIVSDELYATKIELSKHHSNDTLFNVKDESPNNPNCNMFNPTRISNLTQATMINPNLFNQAMTSIGPSYPTLSIPQTNVSSEHSQPYNSSTCAMISPESSFYL